MAFSRVNEHDYPVCQLRIRDAKQRLAKMDIAWRPEWAQSKLRSRPR